MVPTEGSKTMTTTDSTTIQQPGSLPSETELVEATTALLNDPVFTARQQKILSEQKTILDQLA